jgi:ABC-type multidrug transport system permease subunit
MKDITEAEQHITTFSISFAESHYKRDVDKQINELIDKTGRNNDAITKKTSRRYARGFLAQTFILMKRSFLNAMRNILMFWIRVAMYMCLAMLMGAAWWQVGYHQKNVQDRLSAHFFSVAFLSFMSVAGIPGFLEERLVFQRERSNGFYSVGPYVLANTLISIPFLMIISVSFSVIAYPMIGLHSSFHSFANFLLYLFLGLFVAESMVVFISAAIPIFVAALAINAFANGFFMVVEGYFVRRDAIPKELKWAHYFDYQKYAFEAIIKNDLTGLVFNCDKDPSGVENCNCIYGGTNSSSTCHSTGQDVLNYFGYTEIVLYKWAVCIR